MTKKIETNIKKQQTHRHRHTHKGKKTNKAKQKSTVCYLAPEGQLTQTAADAQTAAGGGCH